jgi:hypothetical protein
MIPSNSWKNISGTFSANVRLYLYVNERKIELASVGPDFAILRSAETINETKGEIETIVDDKITRWPIQITTPPNQSRRLGFEGVG